MPDKTKLHVHEVDVHLPELTPASNANDPFGNNGKFTGGVGVKGGEMKK